jgi:hypothetical protein
MTLIDIITQWSVFAIVAAVLGIRRQLTLFHPSTYYLLFHCIVFCIRPTLVWAADFDTVFEYMQIRPDPETLRKTLHVSSFALVILAASFSAVCTVTQSLDIPTRPVISPGARKAFWLMAVIIVPLGIYSIQAQDFSGQHVRGVYILTSSSGYINDLQQVLVSVVVLFAFVMRWRWYSFLPMIAFIYYRAGEGLARWMMIYAVIFTILVYLWDYRRRLPPVWVLLPLTILMFVFANLTLDRSFVRRWIEGDDFVVPISAKADATFKEKYDTMDFANFDYLAFVLGVIPEKTRGYNYGAQHLQLFTEPIPRKLWAGKPAGAPVTLIDWSPYGNTLGITYSVVGDGWISYGWIGVAVNMVLYGIALATLYNWFIVHQGHTYRNLMYLLLTSILVQIFRDGSFVTIAKFLLFTSLPILLWWAFHKFLFNEEFEENPEVKTI